MKTAEKILSKRIVVLLLVSLAVIAAEMTIDSRSPAYRNLSNVNGTDIHTLWDIRTAGLTQITAAYRLTHGIGSLPAGTVVRVIWGNGSYEKAMVANMAGSMGTVPVPGTQVEACTSDCDIKSPREGVGDT